jgi:hypothetical protein
MSSRFDYYDAIAHLIPGAIGCLVILYFCDVFSVTLPRPRVGSLGGLGIGVAVAYTVGHLLQSLASAFEPMYYFVWGGKPSVRLLEKRSDRFSEEQRRDLVHAFVKFFDMLEPCPQGKNVRRNYYQRVFEKCMGVCNRNKLGRVETFVTIYGFHRVLLTTFLLAFAGCAFTRAAIGLGALLLPSEKLRVLNFMTWMAGASALIEVFRARQRAYHYAHEVIMMTSDFIRSSGSASSPM